MGEFLDFLSSTGFANIGWQSLIMLLIAFAFIFVAVSRDLEPYELLPIGLGIIIANLPGTGMTELSKDPSAYQESGIFGIIFHSSQSP